MPGVYKEKNCKFCNKLFRKKGLYCSQSCASFDREPTDAQRENMRKVATEYNRTPEALARQSYIGTSLASLPADDFAVGIPDTTTLDDFYEHTEGFDRAEDW